MSNNVRDCSDVTAKVLEAVNEYSYSNPFVFYFENILHLAAAELVGDCKYVLDLCCGMGHHLSYETKRGRTVVGVDSSEHWLSIARQRNPGVECIKGDATCLPFNDQSFDAVVSLSALEHLNDLEQVIHEAHRVLKSGGCFVVGLPCEGLAYRLGRWFTTRRQMEMMFKGYDYIALCKYEHCNELQDIVPLLQKHFTVETIRWLPSRIPLVMLNVWTVIRCTA